MGAPPRVNSHLQNDMLRLEEHKQLAEVKAEFISKTSSLRRLWLSKLLRSQSCVMSVAHKEVVAIRAAQRAKNEDLYRWTREALWRYLAVSI